jgi:diaminobutyrate-2-oxoglutarate transaminase
MTIFERRESGVYSYARAFPAVFEKAKGPFLFDTKGKRYIDFFCGAGSLNYGHNPPHMVQAIQQYLGRDGVIHSLDMWTSAKAAFLERFESVVLQTRDLNYKVQFTGPTGANAVEAALKLARKVTRRSNVVAFTHSYHGLSLGALAVTANSFYRNDAFVNRQNVSFMPYDGYLGADVDTIRYLAKTLGDKSSGIDLPAAIIVETAQAEGGVNVAGTEWLQKLDSLCRRFDALLIVDDIQVGCGRTGTFFSFERAGIRPDMVILSKSISGMGLPMSLLLIKSEYDQWKPGEHTGTFRGNNLAFITATEALRDWEDTCLMEDVSRKSELLGLKLNCLRREFPAACAQVRGIGLIFGLELVGSALAKNVSQTAFECGLIIERCGPDDDVLKFLPPLVIEPDVLEEGLEIVRHSIARNAFA